jgi:hypothetical protein
MKQLDIATFVAVMQEMLGLAFWPLVVLAAAATAAFIVVLVLDRGVRARRLLWSEAAGLVGGIASMGVLLGVTGSHLADIGGPIDWLLVAAVVVVGAIGTTIAAYTVLGLARRA